jgi:hypothetical protein
VFGFPVEMHPKSANKGPSNINNHDKAKILGKTGGGRDKPN